MLKDVKWCRMETHDKPPSQRLPGTGCGPEDYHSWCRQSWADQRRWGDVWFTNVWGTAHRDLAYIHEPFNDEPGKIVDSAISDSLAISMTCDHQNQSGWQLSGTGCP